MRRLNRSLCLGPPKSKINGWKWWRKIKSFSNDDSFLYFSLFRFDSGKEIHYLFIVTCSWNKRKKQTPEWNWIESNRRKRKDGEMMRSFGRLKHHTMRRWKWFNFRQQREPRRVHYYRFKLVGKWAIRLQNFRWPIYNIASDDGGDLVLGAGARAGDGNGSVGYEKSCRRYKWAKWML